MFLVVGGVFVVKVCWRRSQTCAAGVSGAGVRLHAQPAARCLRSLAWALKMCAGCVGTAKEGRTQTPHTTQHTCISPNGARGWTARCCCLDVVVLSIDMPELVGPTLTDLLIASGDMSPRRSAMFSFLACMAVFGWVVARCAVDGLSPRLNSGERCVVEG